MLAQVHFTLEKATDTAKATGASTFSAGTPAQ